MLKYAFMSPPLKKGVKGKAIHRQTSGYIDIHTDLIRQKGRPTVIETTHPILLGSSWIRIQSYL